MNLVVWASHNSDKDPSYFPISVILWTVVWASHNSDIDPTYFPISVTLIDGTCVK